MAASTFAVIPTHNEHTSLLRLLPVLTADTEIAKVVVVDNGSTDGTIPAIKAAFPQVFVIDNKANLGRVRGLNIGIKFALDNRAMHLLLISPAMVPPDQLVGQLLARPAPVRLPILTMERGGQTWYGFGGSENRRSGLPIAHWQVTKPPKSFNSMPHFFTTACLLAHRQVFETVGMLPEHYTSSFADIAWSELVRSAGVKIVVLPQVVVAYKPLQSQSQTSMRQRQTALLADLQQFVALQGTPRQKRSARLILGLNRLFGLQFADSLFPCQPFPWF